MKWVSRVAWVTKVASGGGRRSSVGDQSGHGGVGGEGGMGEDSCKSGMGDQDGLITFSQTRTDPFLYIWGRLL